MIVLDDKYVIDTDEYQFILGIPKQRTLTDKRTGEEKPVITWDKQSFHPTLPDALSMYFRRKQRDLISSATFTPDEAAVALKQLAAEFETIASKYGCLIVPK